MTVMRRLMLDRRQFLTALGAGALAGCRSRSERGPLVLRLSHSMASGTTALHVFGDKFRELAEAATGGAVKVRVFPSGTLGQEREVVQQLQEGLVDFMVSGTAIWGSVAPKLQVLDFPFLWRDWAHVHGVVDGRLGQEASAYLEQTVRMRPFAWGDSFGFRHVITRSRDVTEPGQLAGLKIRTIQSPIYVKAVELMGASPTPMAFGEVYTSIQTGVIDGYEHDASTTLHQRFYEVAHHMARTGHIAGVLGLWASTASLARPARRPSRDARAGRAGGRAAPARDGRAGGCIGDRAARRERDDHPRDRRPRVPSRRRAALEYGSARAWRRTLARDDSRMTAAHTAIDPHPGIVPHPPAPASARGPAAPVVDRVPRRRPGGRRGPAGRRPPRHAPANPLDRGNRAAAAGLADVRRRDLRAAARSASAGQRAGAPPLAGRAAPRWTAGSAWC